MSGFRMPGIPIFTVSVYFIFQNAEEDAGRIGLLIVVCGMAGSMVCGVVLDKTHQYK